MSIALNMIIGPFEEPFLEAAIKSALPIVDEVVIVDTSPDNQPNADVLMQLFEQIKEKAIKLMYVEFTHKPFSFAAARELARESTCSEWILRLDADEVLHEKDYATLVNATNLVNIAAIEVTFYHFMVYPWLYQYIEPKIILFKKDAAKWSHNVHEVLHINGKVYKLHSIKYYHYGYCRGQAEVFKRWQLYVELDGRPHWYNGVNPEHILDDRISVCQNFSGQHPKVVEPTLDKMFPYWREEPTWKSV